MIWIGIVIGTFGLLLIFAIIFGIALAAEGVHAKALKVADRKIIELRRVIHEQEKKEEE